MTDAPTGWPDALTARIARTHRCCVDRAEVLDRVDSTQDAARRALAEGERGVLVCAAVQTGGRGRRGARWDDAEGMTLPCSFALRSDLDARALAARSGLAALDAVARWAPEHDVRIKWPNDIIVRTDGDDRKIAGVLTERDDERAVVGIGINTIQRERDFPEHWRARAVSLAMLGARVDRAALACDLIETMSRWLGETDDAVRARWRDRDAMTDRTRRFVVGGEPVEGLVRAIDPLGSIELRTDSGVVSLDTRTATNA